MHGSSYWSLDAYRPYKENIDVVFTLACGHILDLQLDKSGSVSFSRYKVYFIFSLTCVAYDSVPCDNNGDCYSRHMHVTQVKISKGRVYLFLSFWRIRASRHSLRRVYITDSPATRPYKPKSSIQPNTITALALYISIHLNRIKYHPCR